MSINEKLNDLCEKLKNILFRRLSQSDLSHLRDIVKNIPEQDVDEDLLEIVKKKSGPSLIREFNQYFLQSRDNEVERVWNCFEPRFDVDHFLKKYSKLETDIIDSFKDYLVQITEVYGDLQADREEITASFAHNFGPICKIVSGKGDIHNGNTVTLVYFENGKLIYKPQKYTQQGLLAGVLGFIQSKISTKIEFSFPNILSINDHSWVEYIVNQQLERQGESSFFYEMGVYIAAFFIFGSNDMHYENMLVKNNHPVFIDLETLCAIPLSENVGKKRLRNSVLNTGVLPTVRTKILDVNVSAIFRDPKEVSEVIFKKSIDFDYSNGFTIHNEPASIIGDSREKNADVLYGNKSSLENLKKGFKEALTVIVENKVTIKEKIKKILRVNPLEIREVLRSTQVYAEFLQAIGNPNTRLKNEQKKILELLNRKPEEEKILLDEQKALARGWIPSYYVKTNKRNLYNADGEVVSSNFLRVTPENRVYKWLDCLDETDVSYQVRLIELSFYETHVMATKNNSASSISNPSNSDSLEINIEHFLESFKKFQIEKGSPAFYSLQLLPNNHINIWSLSLGLWNSSGWALLLAIQGIKRHNRKEIIIAEKINNEIMNQIHAGVFKMYFRQDFSLETGLLGSLFVNEYMTRHGLTTIYHTSDIILDDQELTSEELKVYKDLIHGRLSENVVNGLLCHQRSLVDENPLLESTMSPVFSGALNELYKKGKLNSGCFR
ncbi:DUF4135 domain-containing protein [uncultured Secundilactobacillus sp.]|uniref:DUF4135 domain-containing protein n=1 Tax=uncultured Secundilactobacillus sp. TaxID=2813935 RepID=UPI0025856ED7|nr:DUF4135 domain-containing protein [uncultured Secundilactobacillus sp.]